MEKVLDYRIVQAGSAHDLQRKVCDLLEEGWRPQGGVCQTHDDWMYLQAIVKVSSTLALIDANATNVVQRLVPVPMEAPIPVR